MVGFCALMLGLSGLVIVSGVVELPVWPGISAGLVTVIVGWFGVRQKGSRKTQNIGRTAGWAGVALGGLAAVLGVSLYLGAWFWATG